MVPVIRGVEGMNFADIEKTINELGEKVSRSHFSLCVLAHYLVDPHTEKTNYPHAAGVC